MSAVRNGLCALVIVVLVAIPLAGCAGGEAGPISAQAGVGVVRGVIEGLKREDDEAELKELAEHEPSAEEREQAKEHAEEVSLAEAQAAEQPQSEQVAGGETQGGEQS